MINPKEQMILSTFIPTGLYGFKKIKKLQLGIITYFSSFVVPVIILSIYIAVNGWIHGDINKIDLGLIKTISLPVLILGYIIPIFFIRKWTIEYNKINALN